MPDTNLNQVRDRISLLKPILLLYKKAIENIPALKYSWGVIALACVYSILGYFKFNRQFEIPVKAFLIILGLTFLVFLFAFITRSKDKIVRIALYILIYSLFFVIIALLVSIPIYIYSGEPKLYDRFLKNTDGPSHFTHIDTIQPNHNDSETVIVSKKINNKNGHVKRQSIITSRSVTISIQLSQKTEGFKKIFLEGSEIPTLPESTIFNPRIKIKGSDLSLRIAILTNSGDTCVTFISHLIDTSFYRLVPNCN